MRGLYCIFVCLQFAHWASFRIMACFSLGRCVSGENTVLNVPFLTQSSDYIVLHLQSAFYSGRNPNHCENALTKCFNSQATRVVFFLNHLLCAEIRLWSKRISNSILCVCLTLLLLPDGASFRHYYYCNL